MKRGTQVRITHCAEAGLEKYKDKIFAIDSEVTMLGGQKVVWLSGVDGTKPPRGPFALKYLERVL